MKRIYQLSFVLLITLLFAQCDDSEKLAKPHLSLSELQEKVTTSEAFINFRTTAVQNYTNSINHISKLNKPDRKALRGITEKYDDVDDFTKNATKSVLEEFSKLTKITEVENTQRDIKVFESYIDNLKRDFDYSQENLSFVISEGFFYEVKTARSLRIGCMMYCTIEAIGVHNFVYNDFINSGTSPSQSNVYADTASFWYYSGCIDGCGNNME